MAHILLVEDSALVASALRTLFEANGYRVSVAGDIATAVTQATEDPADIILLDLSLPDGNGLLVLSHLRERNALPRATIALTGHEDDAIREACLVAGCQSVLVKPVPIQELLALVQSL
jgi:two-component system torCAD operon response regulator TorR